jgi:hypothetical protein
VRRWLPPGSVALFSARLLAAFSAYVRLLASKISRFKEDQECRTEVYYRWKKAWKE